MVLTCSRLVVKAGRGQNLRPRPRSDFRKRGGFLVVQRLWQAALERRESRTVIGSDRIWSRRFTRCDFDGSEKRPKRDMIVERICCSSFSSCFENSFLSSEISFLSWVLAWRKRRRHRRL